MLLIWMTRGPFVYKQRQIYITLTDIYMRFLPILITTILPVALIGPSEQISIVTNMLSSSLCNGFDNLFGWSVDRGEYGEQVAWQCCPSKYRKVVAGRWTGLTVLARSHSLVHGVRSIRTPELVPLFTRPGHRTPRT